MKFKIGDKVIFRNYNLNHINNNIKYDMEKTYTVIDIRNADLYLDIDPTRPLHNERFLLDIKTTRKLKLQKIFQKNT